jgi:hypothetical protein
MGNDHAVFGILAIYSEIYFIFFDSFDTRTDSEKAKDREYGDHFENPFSCLVMHTFGVGFG